MWVYKELQVWFDLFKLKISLRWRSWGWLLKVRAPVTVSLFVVISWGWERSVKIYVEDDQSCPTLKSQPTDLCFLETSWHFTGFLHPAGLISMEFNWLISLESFLKYQRLVFSQHEISFLSFFLLDLHNFHLPGPQLKHSIIHSLQGVRIKHCRTIQEMCNVVLDTRLTIKARPSTCFLSMISQQSERPAW